mmetsp:Transcript_65161/g.132548  ORF Transcript_65161/g.132548 Transcript_65161/m.132548 type:complete len:431 (-) Transcript_65161:224-1516(-)
MMLASSTRSLVRKAAMAAAASSVSAPAASATGSVATRACSGSMASSSSRPTLVHGSFRSPPLASGRRGFSSLPTDEESGEESTPEVKTPPPPPPPTAEGDASDENDQTATENNNDNNNDNTIKHKKIQQSTYSTMNISAFLLVALSSVATTTAFLYVPSSHPRATQRVATSSPHGSGVVLEMGSKQATKWEKKQEWLAGRGMSADDASGDEGSASSSVNIIIAGAPASGKGTQCEIIKEEFGVVHLSTGDMLRAAVAAGTDVGVQAKEFMDSGKLVPDEVIIGIIRDRLDEADCKEQGWLLDGFPRTAAQAEALADAGCTADCFLFLDVPDEVLVERVVGRRTDPETGKIYHLTFSPPPADDEALVARLEHRSDDTEEKVVVRLEQFHANVAAVKGSYEDIMISIDETRAPADVSADIMESVKAAVAKRA